MRPAYPLLTGTVLSEQRRSAPAMRQQLLDAASRVRRQPLEYVLQLGVRIEVIHLCRTDQAHDRRGVRGSVKAPPSRA